MIFVDQVSAAIPVLLLLTRSKVPHHTLLHSHAASDATLPKMPCCQASAGFLLNKSCIACT